MSLRCPACPERDSRTPFPQPTGPRPCRILCVGEGPSTEEYRQGRVFAGKTGAEVDGQYFPLAGLLREDVFVMNASACAGRTKTGALDNPTDEQAAVCASYFLPSTLREVQPEIVILMGAVACRAVLGEVDLEMDHGLPWRGSKGLLQGWWDSRGGNAEIVCTWHPAAGLRDTNWMIGLQDDFRRLRKILRGDYSDIAVDSHPHPEYTEVLTEHDVDSYFGLRAIFANTWHVGIDTESIGGIPWSVQASVEPGTGILVSADRPDLLARVQHWTSNLVWVMHAAAADLPMAAAMGLHPRRRWVDTMQQAYWAQEFRIGLKPLAYRHLGMRMTDYLDVVGPPSKLELHQYMCDVQRAMTGVVPKSRKGVPLAPEEAALRSTYAKVKRLAGDIERDLHGIKPWDRIKGWDKDQTHDRQVIEDFAAKAIPVPSIAHVERADAIHYSVRDADACLRLLPVIRRKALELRRVVA